MIKKHFWKIVFALVVVLMGASVWYAQYASSKANEGVTITDHIKGPQNAKVKLTEYGDFQCPACGAFYPVVSDVLSKYGDQIQFEFKNFPLLTIHPYALPAAKAAEAASQQGKFFEMYDKLYQNQQAWSQSATPQVFFDQYAKDIGLNVPQFKEQMKSSIIENHIRQQYEDAQKLGLTGTPSFYLNGQKLEFQTIGDFMNAIESALGIASSSASTSQESAPVKFGI